MTASSPPSRKHLIRALETAADLMDILGEEAFRAQAYRSAARSLEAVTLETPELLAREFAGIPKVGRGIAAELSEAAHSGAFAPLEAAAAQLPPGLLELLDVRGLGPKKIRALWLSGIDSAESLRESCENGGVAGLKGFGAKSAATILSNVEFLLGARQHQHLSTGMDVADTLLGGLAALDARVSGEVRRGLETVRVVRVTVTGTPETVTAQLAGRVDDLAPVEGKPVVAGRVDGVPVEVAFAAADTRGALDLLMTGSAEYRETVRAQAQERGFDLSGRGLIRAGVTVTTPSEADVYRELGLPFRPPEYREAEHDALWETLPAPGELLTTADLRGMIHTHSTWSDGTASIREMVQACVDLGYEFLGTGDHSRAAHYAGGLSTERLEEQLREVRELQALGLPLVAGTEVDILEDGTLDYPDDVLATLDYVVASVHSHFTLDPARQTERLIRAASHPLVTVLGHPTGRLLLRRPGYALDLDAVLAACEAHGTAVEINANAARLDVDWRVALRWRGRVRFAVNTDAHVPGGLADARYGVAMARKAGLTPADVINTLSQENFLAFVAAQRAARGV